MRMLPIAFYLYYVKSGELSKETIDIIYEVSNLTHGHILSKMLCVYYVNIIFRILEMRHNKSLNSIIEFAIKEVEEFYIFKNEDIVIYNYMKSNDLLSVKDLERNDIESSGFVIHSLESVIWCLLKTNSYKEAVLKIVNLGNDTDTNAAILGSIAVIYYGFDNIPLEFKEVIRNRSLIDKICNKFIDNLIGGIGE